MRNKKIICEGFEKHPERINRKGRPMKFVNQVIKDLEVSGIESVKPSQVVGLYEVLMNCTLKQLRDFANDEMNCWEVRTTAKYMLKFPYKAWSEIKDRAHGKAKQTAEIEYTPPREVQIIVQDQRTADNIAMMKEMDKPGGICRPE